MLESPGCASNRSELLVRLCYMHIKMYIRSIFNLFNTGQYRHEAVEETLVCAF